MAERDFKGVWIPKEIWLADDIGWSAKLLLVEIDSLAKNGECFATNEYFGQFFSLSKDRISKLISELREKGYVEVNIIYKDDSKQIDKRLITTTGYRRKCLQGIVESADTTIGTNDDTPIGENAEDNNTSSINTSFINTDNKSIEDLDNPPPPPPTKAPKSKRKRTTFVPPTLEEVQEYCKQRKNNVNPQKFYDYFTASGWVDSKGKKVVSWKQKIITWESYHPNSESSGGKTYGANGIAVSDKKSDLDDLF